MKYNSIMTENDASTVNIVPRWVRHISTICGLDDMVVD